MLFAPYWDRSCAEAESCRYLLSGRVCLSAVWPLWVSHAPPCKVWRHLHIDEPRWDRPCRWVEARSYDIVRRLRFSWWNLFLLVLVFHFLTLLRRPVALVPSEPWWFLSRLTTRAWQRVEHKHRELKTMDTLAGGRLEVNLSAPKECVSMLCLERNLLVIYAGPKFHPRPKRTPRFVCPRLVRARRTHLRMRW